MLIPPPVGGINLATSIDKLQAIEAEQLRGFEFDEYGVMGAPRAPKNLGTILAGATVLSAWVFYRDSGATQLIVHLSDGSIRYSTDFLTTSGSATWTTITTGQSTTAPFTFITFLNTVWFTNGTNNYAKWDGATYTAYASAPKGKYLALWRDTLWQSGDPANPHRVYQSAAGDPSSWPAFNFVDIEKGVGIGVTALFSVESSLVVFKLHKTHIIFDPIEYTNRVIDGGKGCISHYSIVSHQGTFYFASHVGICRFLGDGPSQLVSEKISPIFNDLMVFGTSLATFATDWTEENTIWGYSFENFVGWYLPSNAYSQYVKLFPDLPDAPWVFGAPMDPPTLTGRACLLNVRDPLRYAQLFRIAGNPAIIYREYGDTAAATVTCQWRSSWFDFDSPFTEKYISALEVLFRGTISITLNRDYRNEQEGGEDSEAVATNLAAPLTKLTTQRVYTDTYCRQLQIVVDSVTAGEVRGLMASGVSGEAQVSRFQAGIAAITVKAKALSEMRL
jgi:hypothetical protein